MEKIEEINKITIDPPMQRSLVNIYLMQYINEIQENYELVEAEMKLKKELIEKFDLEKNIMYRI